MFLVATRTAMAVDLRLIEQYDMSWFLLMEDQASVERQALWFTAFGIIVVPGRRKPA